MCGLVLGVLALAGLSQPSFVVSEVAGYNSWPMVVAMGETLVCSYSRDRALPADGHTITPGTRDAFVRVSHDGAHTWSEELALAADPTVGEVNEGIGLDSTSAALLWVRGWGKDRRHELYRTRDGLKFEKLAVLRPDPLPMQITDIVRIEGLGLASPWFAGNYREGNSNSWGLFVSTDDGRTWKKSRTNISDVLESTPSLVYDRATDKLFNYYYQRGQRQLKRRIVSASFIFDHPQSWPEPEVLTTGSERRHCDAGNVNVTRRGTTDYCAWYTGSPSNSTVLVTLAPTR